jgi:hypothetical protein
VSFFLTKQVIGIVKFGCIAASWALRESHSGHGGLTIRDVVVKFWQNLSRFVIDTAARVALYLHLNYSELRTGEIDNVGDDHGRSDEL